MSIASTSYGSLADPPASSALLAATSWVEQLLLGGIATAIACIAIAWVGMMTLTGRLPVRRGVTVVIGCFILFEAPAIARGIQAFVGSGDGGAALAQAEPTPPVAPPAPPAIVRNDPYAGAAVPRR